MHANLYTEIELAAIVYRCFGVHAAYAEAAITKCLTPIVYNYKNVKIKVKFVLIFTIIKMYIRTAVPLFLNACYN